MVRDTAFISTTRMDIFNAYKPHCEQCPKRIRKGMARWETPCILPCELGNQELAMPAVVEAIQAETVNDRQAYWQGLAALAYAQHMLEEGEEDETERSGRAG